MNLYVLGLLSLLSTIFTFIGYKFLTPFTIKSFNGIELVLQSALNSFTQETPDSYKLIAALILTILGFFMAFFCITQLFNLEINDALITIAVIVIAAILVFDAVFSFYLLLFAILILIILFIMLSLLFLFLYMVTFSSGGGSVHVRGHFRRGSYVRSHTRRRPRKRF